MSTFKTHTPTADRSAADRRRHKQKIEKAIREGVYDIVAEESIIGQDGKKKIKIPVRGIKEYRFIYGDNQSNKKVGSAPGVEGIQRGQQIGKGRKKDQGQGDQASDQAGEEYYEIEITLEELAAYLFDSLQLPDLEKKKMKKILSEKFKRHGYRNDGIRPRLDKKQTLRKKLKRKKSAMRAGTYDPEEDDRFTFHQDDLRYRHIKQSTTEASNAVIVFLMDISGSMTQDKKFLARSFFFLLYQFIRHRYENTEIVFVSHDVQAYEVNEEQFFSRGVGGGTMVSSGLELTLDILNKRYHPDNWNIYVFQSSDGDNWPGDIDKTLTYAERIKNMCQLFGYCEIETDQNRLEWMKEKETALSTAYTHMDNGNFKMAEIRENADVWMAFKKFFGGKLGV